MLFLRKSHFTAGGHSVSIKNPRHVQKFSKTHRTDPTSFDFREAKEISLRNAGFRAESAKRRERRSPRLFEKCTFKNPGVWAFLKTPGAHQLTRKTCSPRLALIAPRMHSLQPGRRICASLQILPGKSADLQNLQILPVNTGKSVHLQICKICIIDLQNLQILQEESA